MQSWSFWQREDCWVEGQLFWKRYVTSYWWQIKIEKVVNEDIVWDDTYDWGDFERFRKAVIRAGKPDPFICQHCNVLKVFIGVQFPEKTKNGKKNKQSKLVTINDSS